MSFFAFKLGKMRGVYASRSGFRKQTNYYLSCAKKESCSLSEAIKFLTSDLPSTATPVYTDGSYSQCTHRAGWGVFVDSKTPQTKYGPVSGLFESRVNNVYAEFVAISKALETIEAAPVGTYEIFTDCQDFCEIIWRLYDVWSKTKFINLHGHAVAHKELLQHIHSQLDEIEKRGSAV